MERVIVVKEYTDAKKTSYNIGIISNDKDYLSSATLTHITMPLETGLVFNKII